MTKQQRTKCNKIEAQPVSNEHGHTFYFCWTCGKDLEVTTTATGFRHTRDGDDYGKRTFDRQNPSR